MRKFSTGLVLGLLVGLILATSVVATATPQAIKLIINGQEIHPDVPPQMINGRIMVPARFVAEPLGARVEWNGSTNSVIITSAPTEASIDQAVPIEQNNLEGASTTMTEPNLTEWISLRDLAKSGVTLQSTPHGVVLTKGGQSVPFDLPEMNEGKQITVSGIRVWRTGSRTYLNLDDLANLGLTP